MLKNVSDTSELRQLLLSIFSTSGTLAGLSMTLVGIINFRSADVRAQTIADDLFLLSGVGFLIVCYLVFFTLRRLHSKSLRFWTVAIDSLFLASMTLLVVSGFVVLYQFGSGYSR